MPAANYCGGLKYDSLSSPTGCVHSHSRSSIPVAVRGVGSASPCALQAHSPIAWPKLQRARRCWALHCGARSITVLVAEMGARDPCQGVVARGLGMVTPYCCGHLPKPFCGPRKGAWPVPGMLIEHLLAKCLCCFSCSRRV